MFKNAAIRIKNFTLGHYTLLLFFILFLFMFRPYNRTHAYLLTWHFLLAGTILSSIFNCHHKQIVKWAASILAIPTIGLSWINVFFPSEPVFIGLTVCTISFLSLCAASILYDVVLRAHVTLETLRGVICAYCLVAFVFAFIYFLIEYLNPNTIVFTTKDISIYEYTYYISEMLYFSFTTLLTIGYGDIVAVKDVGQTTVVLEGMVGQFYVAMLVARLVSVYSFYSDKRLRRSIRKNKKK